MIRAAIARFFNATPRAAQIEPRYATREDAETLLDMAAEAQGRARLLYDDAMRARDFQHRCALYSYALSMECRAEALRALAGNGPEAMDRAADLLRQARDYQRGADVREISNEPMEAAHA
jgi:hypothetical protein